MAVMKKIGVAYLCVVAAVAPLAGCKPGAVLSPEDDARVTSIEQQMIEAEAEGDAERLEALKAERLDILSTAIEPYTSIVGTLLGFINPTLGGIANSLGPGVADAVALFAFPRVRQNAIAAISESAGAVSKVAHADFKGAAAAVGSAAAHVAAVPGLLHSSKRTAEMFQAERRGTA